MNTPLQKLTKINILVNIGKKLKKIDDGVCFLLFNAKGQDLLELFI